MVTLSHTSHFDGPAPANGHSQSLLELPLRTFDLCSPRQSEGVSRDMIDWCRTRIMEPVIQGDDREVTYAIGLDEHRGLVGTIPRKHLENEERVLQRLVSLSADLQQSRTTLEMRDRDLTSVLDHVAQMYSHITLTFDVARTLKSESSLDGVLRTILRDLPGTIHADAVGLYVTESRLMAEIKVSEPQFSTLMLDRFVELLDRTASGKEIVIETVPPLQRGGSGRCGTLCGARIRTADGRSGWLLAYRSDGKLGTEEGQLLRSLTNILTGQLDTAALLAEKDMMLLSMIRSFVSALDARDQYTRGHSERVAEVASELARQLGLNAEMCDDIHLSGLLHDIGKIGVSDEVLLKVDKLTDADWAEIKRHPVIGENILRGISPLEKILPGVRSHHEAFDGNGYPDRLAGENIPYMARILAVADAFDAMSSDRPYRKGKPKEEVESILRSGAGRQWDPGVIHTFLNNKEKIHQVWLRQVAAQVLE